MDLTDLRQAAVERLRQSHEDARELGQQSPAELIHELRVHQIELEMQNEELRRAQLELEEARDRFAELFDFAPVGYLTLDPQGRIVAANLTIAELLGLERGKLVGQVLARFVISEDATRLALHFRDVDKGEEKISGEFTLKHAAGNAIWVRFHSMSVAGGNRGGSRSIAIVDLSQRADILRAKQDSEERLRVICHTLPIPIAYVDRTEAYQFNNAAHEAWFGISRASIMGRHVKDVLGEAIYEVVTSRIKRVLAGQVCSGRVELPGGELGTRSVEIHFAPHRGAEKQVVGYYELMIDVSANRHVEAEEARRASLQAQLRKLSDRQRDVFRLLMAGKPNKVITHELDLGMRTVERERHDILELLGVASINEMLVSYAGLAAANDAPAEA